MYHNAGNYRVSHIFQSIKCFRPLGNPFFDSLFIEYIIKELLQSWQVIVKELNAKNTLNMVDHVSNSKISPCQIVTDKIASVLLREDIKPLEESLLYRGNGCLYHFRLLGLVLFEKYWSESCSFEIDCWSSFHKNHRK